MEIQRRVKVNIMNKKMFVLALFIPLIPFMMTLEVQALDFEYGDWSIFIKITPSADKCYLGDDITLHSRVEAIDDLTDGVFINMYLHGLTTKDEEWVKRIPILLLPLGMSAGATRDDDTNVTIPSNLLPGLIYAVVQIEYDGWIPGTITRRSKDKSVVVPLIYVKNKDYEQLQIEGARATTTRNLMYFFICTTTVLSISTLYFAIRKRKK